ncbi:MAG TPA: HypC/HybG/HupF family hydrogenase formation chaperone [Candidatus Xenobia bacterium]|jgi:hydrogenase expression/formation protein HypC
MCLAIPGQILELGSDDLATVDVSGVRRRVNVGLLSGTVGPGDWVLIHVGFAMSRIDEEEAKTTLDFLYRMGQAWMDEVEALEASAIE